MPLAPEDALGQPGGLALTGTEPDASLEEPFGLALDAEADLDISDSGHTQDTW